MKPRVGDVPVVRRRWLRTWAADGLVIRRSGVVRGAFLVFLLFFAYVIHIAGDMVTSTTLPGYYSRQSLLAMALYGRYAVAIVAAVLGTIDGQSNTWGTRLTACPPTRLAAVRLTFLVAVSVGATLVAFVIGEILDALLSLSGAPSASLIEFALVSLDVSLWALIAFAVATLTRSLAVSAGGLIVYTLLEMFLESRLSPSVLAFLPNWNTLATLRPAFPDEDAGISIVLVHQGTVGWTAGACGVYLTAAVLLSVAGMRREV